MYVAGGELLTEYKQCTTVASTHCSHWEVAEQGRILTVADKIFIFNQSLYFDHLFAIDFLAD